MTTTNGFNDKVAFIWSVADLLRGDVKPHEYGQFILPFVVLRRLDCVLEPTKQKVIDKAASLSDKVGNVEPILERVSGAPFYNTSMLTFQTLLNDPANIKANLNSYVAGFSTGAAEVLEKYRFPERIATLDKAGLLYQVVAKFADIDLHPNAVPNHAMGYIFEELLRRFSEMQNETAGEHFTPREVIKLMVNILFSQDENALSGTAPVRTMLDPAAGTGGMLSTAQDHLAELNPDAHLEVYGQELNPETWAICRSDMLIKGEDPENIVLGNSFTADGHHGTRFDYLMTNPPFGVDWKKYADAVEAEAENEGDDGRFGAGLPRISDGSFLFLQHMISKMKPVTIHRNGTVEGGTRLAIVFSGSPLFSGAAESGESNIRRWIIENDWLEAIVALPDQLFYNTGIYTYFWVVTNRKTPEREGKVALIDARGAGSKMKKSLGNKRHYLNEGAITEITRLYADAPHLADIDPRVKVFDNDTFGYQRITVEQPLRRKWVITEDTLTALKDTKAWAKEGRGDPSTIHVDLVGSEYKTEKACAKALTTAGLPTSVIKALVKLAGTADPNAEILLDRKGQPLPDPDLRDYENVPLDQDPDEYLAAEIHPYAPEAWIDHTNTRIGYEIPLTRYFYVYTPPRPMSEINKEITEREKRIRELLETLTPRLDSFAHAAVTGANFQDRMKTSLNWSEELPSHWRVARLATIAQIGTGHTPSRSEPKYWQDCDIPWLTTTDVKHLRADEVETLADTEVHISKIGLENSAAVMHPAGTVGLCRTSASAGYSAIMGVPMATSQDFAVWRPSPWILPRYLLWCLRAMRTDLLDRLAMGSTHKTIYFPDLLSIRVPLPPLDEQRSIVESIGREIPAIVVARREMRAQISLLQERMSSLITAAVTGDLDTSVAARRKAP